MTDDSPAVRLELDSRPETLTLVRGVLAGVAELIGLDPELLDDLPPDDPRSYRGSQTRKITIR